MENSRERLLKYYILANYGSLREFAKGVDLSYSTIDSILKRGLHKSTVDNVLKICRALHISADALANGEIKEVFDSSRESIELDDIFKNTKNIISNYVITVAGEPLDNTAINTIINTLDITLELVKKQQDYNKTTSENLL